MSRCLFRQCHPRVRALPIFETWKEQLHRAYLFWAPVPRVSLSAEVVYDTFRLSRMVSSRIFRRFRSALRQSASPSEYAISTRAASLLVSWQLMSTKKSCALLRRKIVHRSF